MLNEEVGECRTPPLHSYHHILRHNDALQEICPSILCTLQCLFQPSQQRRNLLGRKPEYEDAAVLLALSAWRFFLVGGCCCFCAGLMLLPALMVAKVCTSFVTD